MNPLIKRVLLSIPMNLLRQLGFALEAADEFLLGTRSAFRRIYRRIGPFRPLVIGGWAVALFLLCGYGVWTWDLYSVDRFALGSAERWELWARVGGALVVALGFGLTAWRIAVSDRQTRSLEDGQVTERFARAVEQLGACRADGSPNLEIRVGGIYSLERIAKDSGRDRLTVIEVLSTYVRQNASIEYRFENEQRLAGESAEQKANDVERPRVDIRASLTVISRRERQTERPAVDLRGVRFRRIDLSQMNLRNVDLSSADLEGAVLIHADLSGAILRGTKLGSVVVQKPCSGRYHVSDVEHLAANLSHARLRDAECELADLNHARLTETDLRGAFFFNADLSSATFRGARLRGVDFWLADLSFTDFKGQYLSNANLKMADLKYANLMGADLSKTRNLTLDQLAGAAVDRRTILPRRLRKHREEILESSFRYGDKSTIDPPKNPEDFFPEGNHDPTTDFFLI